MCARGPSARGNGAAGATGRLGARARACRLAFRKVGGEWTVRRSHEFSIADTLAPAQLESVLCRLRAHMCDVAAGVYMNYCDDAAANDADVATIDETCVATQRLLAAAANAGYNAGFSGAGFAVPSEKTCATRRRVTFAETCEMRTAAVDAGAAALPESGWRWGVGAGRAAVAGSVFFAALAWLRREFGDVRGARDAARATRQWRAEYGGE